MNNKHNKSILIFSNPTDISTLEVIKWLNYHERNHYLISSIDDFNLYNLSFNETFFTKSISTIWYRKLFIDAPRLEIDNLNLKKSSYNFLLSELKYFYFGIEKMCKDLKSLGGGFSLMELNKIDVLIEAKKTGLDVPNYLLTSSKKELGEFKIKYKSIITKPIYNAMPIRFSDAKIGLMYTSIIQESDFSKLPNFFFPSFFQEYIRKEYELRIFYLDGKTYSSAIFTESDDYCIDYRDKLKNKTIVVPYKLPRSIEIKIDKLMRKLKLNTGSIDVLKCKENKYYFLEINPSGQYETVSEQSNYQLNEKIAQWLMN